ncbi:MAG: signal peptidase I [Ruminococcaceae bacterium]|nr:signal peptidase I [Oscillospiraceae bacterium]
MNKTKKCCVTAALCRIVLLALCGGVLGMNLYLANAGKLLGDRMPMPFGCGAAVVLSGSMEPALSIDDLIVVCRTQDVAMGDIVVYQDGNILVVHRIVNIDGDRVITRGDANNVADDPIGRDAIKGVVVFRIPRGGAAVALIRSPAGTVCILIAAVALVEIPRRREKEKYEEQQRKIKEEIRRLKDEL